VKILAISDIEDRTLERLVSERSAALKGLNVICSCGDLRQKYIEYVVDGIHKDLYFVEGNHHNLSHRKYFAVQNLASLVYDKDKHLELGGVNLHARAQVAGEYIFAGFGGAMRYNRGPMQFSESQMARLVAKVQRKIKAVWFIDFLKGRRQPRKIIVLSHAPPLGVHDKKDICHTGFKCFVDFIKQMKPVLWMHGHVHFEGQTRHQETLIGDTKVVNVFGSKIIEITAENVISKNIYEIDNP
jgi:Icc-related predicted phosphoesterase